MIAYDLFDTQRVARRIRERVGYDLFEHAWRRIVRERGPLVLAYYTRWAAESRALG